MEIKFSMFLNFFDVISIFFHCFFDVSFLCLVFLCFVFYRYFAFLRFVVLCFVIDPSFSNERIVDGLIRKVVSIDDSQFGFVPGRGTTDAIFVVRQLQEKYLAANKRLYMAFVDLEKAFDRVPRKVICCFFSLWGRLAGAKFPNFF